MKARWLFAAAAFGVVLGAATSAAFAWGAFSEFLRSTSDEFAHDQEPTDLRPAPGFPHPGAGRFFASAAI